MRVAIVGSGISGLVCAHVLQRSHDLHVFEAGDWIGGHTHTVDVEDGGRTLPVDTGFIVFNERTYPEFVRLLSELGVATQPTGMGFAVRCEESGLEYSSRGLDGFFAQRRNLSRPAHLGMLRDILSFHRDARALLRETPQGGDAGRDPGPSLGAWLDARRARWRSGRRFEELFLLPMAGAIWSADPQQMRAFPARSFMRFFQNHGLLQHGAPPRWRVVSGGSRSYVEALVAPIRERVHRRTPVRALRRRAGGGVEVVLPGETAVFDQVIVAAHSDQALALLEAPSRAEREVLGSIRYQPNEVALHSDARFLPRTPGARAAWNFHRMPAGGRDPGGARVTVTYSMNRLQGLRSRRELCVTLNRTAEIDPARLIGVWRKDHPVFDAAALRAQAHRERICGVDRIHYCGAYWGHGFHEDGVRSALQVTRRLAAARGGARAA